MSRRSDNPMTILIMGIVILCGFGVSLVLLTDKTPVLSLKPLVAKEFGAELRTRFRGAKGATPAAVELILKRAEESPPERDEAMAEWSLGKYMELVAETESGKTSIRQIEIRVEDEAASRYVLTLAQFEGKQRAQDPKEQAQLAALVEGSGLREVEFEVLGYSRSGAKLAVRCVAPEGARRVPVLARRALLKLQASDFLGSIQFEVRGGPEPVVLVGGRDTPLRRSRPPRRRPRKRPKGTAPVTSRGP
jgi:hypothetical protein